MNDKENNNNNNSNNVPSVKVIALIDADSIAYIGAFSTTLIDCKNAIDNKVSEIIKNVGADSWELYIEEWRQDKRLFRNKMHGLSTGFTKHEGYKGNRKGMERPHLLAPAKQHLVNRWGATSVIGFESEDVVIRRAYEVLADNNIPIVCAIDKDLLQHPLQFYNYNKKEYTTISKEQAVLNRYRQVCSGDPTDNIPGIPGIGAKKAEAAIQDHETALEDAVAFYKSKGFKYDYFIEQYNLIYIRSENHLQKIYPLDEDQYWDIPRKNK